MRAMTREGDLALADRSMGRWLAFLAPLVDVRLTPRNGAITEPDRAGKFAFGDQTIDGRAAESRHSNHRGHAKKQRRGRVARGVLRKDWSGVLHVSLR